MRLAAIREGDSAAFEEVLRPLVDPACRLAFAMLGDWQEAEDAVQESAFRAWRAASRLRPDTPSFKPWFLTIVANECRSRRRRWWSRVVRLPSPPASITTDVSDLATRGADLDRALSQLDDNSRLALVLHFYLDLPIPETAAVLGVSPAAAKTRIYRATRSLRPELELEST